ncbi:MAG TPA: mechanosensitive ion channel domain-containing protein [Sphingomicrobium sp.]|nr:mechanosensitive ion channel domain-containing protein [Sphingomicrobium sp.]
MNERIVWPSQAWAWLTQNSNELLIGGAVAVALVAVMLILRKVGEAIVRDDPDCRTWRSVVGRVLAKTNLAFMVLAAVEIVARYTEAPPKIAHPLDIAFTIAMALQAAIWGRELIMGIVARHAGDEVGETALDNARAVIRVLVSIALFAIAGIVILDNVGVNVTALIAGFGIGGIAIGLAAQGIFSDLFAALSILFDKPFRRGDTIRYGDSIGTVERIGLKTTRLRSLNGEQLVMANTKLLDQEIHNFAEGQSRRTALPFGVIYQTSPDKLATIPEIARAAVDNRTGCAFIRCPMMRFVDSSIDFELLYESVTIDIDVVATDRTAIMLEIIGKFAEAGIDFAYPTQTTFTAAPDGTMVMPYPAHSSALDRADRDS